MGFFNLGVSFFLSFFLFSKESSVAMIFHLSPFSRTFRTLCRVTHCTKNSRHNSSPKISFSPWMSSQLSLLKSWRKGTEILPRVGNRLKFGTESCFAQNVLMKQNWQLQPPVCWKPAQGLYEQFAQCNGIWSSCADHLACHPTWCTSKLTQGSSKNCLRVSALESTQKSHCVWTSIVVLFLNRALRVNESWHRLVGLGNRNGKICGVTSGIPLQLVCALLTNMQQEACQEDPAAGQESGAQPDKVLQNQA